jgi:ribosomal-protein-alanine N-acetyltransferase
MTDSTGSGGESVLVRAMTAADIPVVAEIDRASNISYWTPAMFERELQLPFSLSVVAEVEGKVVAFGITWIVSGSAQLHQIAVSPDSRRKGVGMSILQHIMSVATRRGCKKMELEVRESNVPAVKFYEKAGFEKVGSRAQFYETTTNLKKKYENAVLMKCELQ